MSNQHHNPKRRAAMYSGPEMAAVQRELATMQASVPRAREKRRAQRGPQFNIVNHAPSVPKSATPKPAPAFDVGEPEDRKRRELENRGRVIGRSTTPAAQRRLLTLLNEGLPSEGDGFKAESTEAGLSFIECVRRVGGERSSDRNTARAVIIREAQREYKASPRDAAFCSLRERIEGDLRSAGLRLLCNTEAEALRE